MGRDGAKIRKLIQRAMKETEKRMAHLLVHGHVITKSGRVYTLAHPDGFSFTGIAQAIAAKGSPGPSRRKAVGK